MEIVQRIDELRMKKGWSLSYLATQLGISRNAVQSWFSRGGAQPNRQTIQVVCQVFGITLTEFYSGIDADKFTAREILLVEYFRRIPEENAGQILAIVKSFAG